MRVSPWRMMVVPASHPLAAVERPTLDQLAELASRLCGTPIAVINLVEDRRQWLDGYQATYLERDLADLALHREERPDEGVVEERRRPANGQRGRDRADLGAGFAQSRARLVIALLVGGELVEVVGLPAEFVDQGRQHQARVGAAGLEGWAPLATGLRNSLGLAGTRAADGTVRLWQAENSVDYTDATLPAEELNELVPGASFGWPYCVSDARGRSVATRGYEGRATCSEHRAPHAAWPAHAAPLQLLALPATDAATLPDSPWHGRLLAVWHGYRDVGHRVTGWALGADGRPTGARQDLVAGWQAAPGVRPRGTPAGITLDHLNRLWIVEDRNRTVIVVAPRP